ncbi:hypothetical protein [Candidatus Dormiibacter inghamiae]|uniref:hypothetical protein n=1 Tax=Candidatus Dormiibacter inghamiae TaxID=3127013 RepID=UPI0030C76FAE
MHDILSLPLSELREAAQGCRACDLWQNATQTVFGEGERTARLLFVGDQPGDHEDRALDGAGIDRRDAYVTNAVKHSGAAVAAA